MLLASFAASSIPDAETRTFRDCAMQKLNEATLDGPPSTATWHFLIRAWTACAHTAVVDAPAAVGLSTVTLAARAVPASVLASLFKKMLPFFLDDDLYDALLERERAALPSSVRLFFGGPLLKDAGFRGAFASAIEHLLEPAVSNTKAIDRGLRFLNRWCEDDVVQQTFYDAALANPALSLLQVELADRVVARYPELSRHPLAIRVEKCWRAIGNTSVPFKFLLAQPSPMLTLMESEQGPWFTGTQGYGGLHGDAGRQHVVTDYHGHQVPVRPDDYNAQPGKVGHYHEFLWDEEDTLLYPDLLDIRRTGGVRGDPLRGADLPSDL